MRISPGRSPTVARQAASLESSRMPGGGESRASGASIGGEDLEGDWLSSGGVPPFYRGFFLGRLFLHNLHRVEPVVLVENHPRCVEVFNALS